MHFHVGLQLAIGSEEKEDDDDDTEEDNASLKRREAELEQNHFY